MSLAGRDFIVWHANKPRVDFKCYPADFLFVAVANQRSDPGDESETIRYKNIKLTQRQRSRVSVAVLPNLRNGGLFYRTPSAGTPAT